MKRPYIVDKTLPAAVEKYLSENKHVEVGDMTVYLMSNYREFRLKKRNLFQKSVQKVFDWQMFLKKQHGELESSDYSISDDDGGGLDIIEMESPPPKKSDVNKMMTNMYKNANSASPNSRRKETEDIYIDLEGESVANGSSSKKGESKKRKQSRKEDGGTNQDGAAKKKKRLVATVEESAVSLKQVVGWKNHKNNLLRMVTYLRHPVANQQFVLRSALLSGPSGSGKSHLARAIVKVGDVALLRVPTTDLLATEDKIKEVFEQAVMSAPCVLLLEKLEVVASKEGGSGRGMERRASSQLVVAMREINLKHPDKAVLILGETCHPESLDHDLRSSFRKEIYLKMPLEHERFEILRIICGDLYDILGEVLLDVSHRTPGFVAGDLQKLVEYAREFALNRREELKEDINEDDPDLTLRLLSDSWWVDSKIVISFDDFTNALKDVVPVLKREGFPTIPEVTWSDIGGLLDIKVQLQEKIIDPIRDSKYHEEFGQSKPNGILMWGPPGCGKTLLAKAVANEAGINFLAVEGPELLNKYQGESERAVREVFARARNVAPCVIFFDEFDSLCPVRVSGAESGSKSSIVNTLLVNLNGFSEQKNVFVMAATNRPDMLDPAVTRPGRFDTTIYVGIPDELSRLSILQACTKNGTRPKVSDDVNFTEIARQTPDLSGADIAQLVYLATNQAIKEIKQSTDSGVEMSTRELSRKHFEAALKEVKPSVSDLERQRYKKLLKRLQSTSEKNKAAALSSCEDVQTDAGSSKATSNEVPNNDVDMKSPL